jgi:hypothetical protein
MTDQRGSFQKRMQVLAYIASTLTLWGVIPALGFVNKQLDLHISNEVMVLVVGGLLTTWQDLTKKIFRILVNGKEG